VSFWLGCWLWELLEGAFGMDFGAFAEEYREVEDGCGHLLRILRVVRGIRSVKCASREYHAGYFLALIKSK
jgi:hypothetical protein